MTSGVTIFSDTKICLVIYKTLFHIFIHGKVQRCPVTARGGLSLECFGSNADLFCRFSKGQEEDDTGRMVSRKWQSFAHTKALHINDIFAFDIFSFDVNLTKTKN